MDDLKQSGFELSYQYDDINAVLDITTQAGGYSWYDSDNNIIGIDYGIMSGKLWFDMERSRLNVTQMCHGVPDTPLSEYLPPVTMGTFGFGFSPEGGMSVYEDHSNNYSSLAFFSPSWGQVGSNWQLEFSYPFGKRRILMWYFPDQNTYHIDINMGNTSASYRYDTQRKVFVDINPDRETVEQYLGELYEGREPEDVYLEIFRILELYTLEVTGMTFDEFSKLPPAEGYPAIDTIPVLPVR